MSHPPTGHEGYCCSGCIEESNEGYRYFDPETCCCRDERDYETQVREYREWLDAAKRAAEAMDRAMEGMG